MKESTIKTILKSIGMTKEEELGCMDCHNEIDQYVEMLRAGKAPEEVKPLIKHHLDICGNCHEEFEALLVAIDNIDTAR